MPILLEDFVSYAPIIGNETLARDRGRLFNYWIANSSFVREAFDEVYQDIRRQLSPNMFNQNNTAMLATYSAVLRERLRRNLGSALSATEAAIEASVASAILRTQRVQTAFLQRLGISPLSETELSLMRSRVLRGLNTEFPIGSGITFRNRIDRLMVNHYSQLSSILYAVHLRGGAQERILRDSRYALTYEGPGNTPIRGGSIYRQSRRLVVAEQARAASQVEIEMARESGLRYAYWRLSPSHRWYGGSEICEVLANSINEDLVGKVKVGGRVLPNGMLRGLYALDNWPMYPHPYCQCYSEPVLF